MMNKAVVILVGLLLMVIVPPFIVYLFKRRKNFDSRSEIMNSLCPNPDQVLIEIEPEEEPDPDEEEDSPGYPEPVRDDRIRRVRQYRKTNPKLHFR